MALAHDKVLFCANRQDFSHIFSCGSSSSFSNPISDTI